MTFLENFKMAVSSIVSNKLRSLLTMLGIIIGISAVITITTLGTTLQGTVNNALTSVGNDLFYAYVDQRNYEEFNNSGPDEEDLMTLDMISELCTKYPDEIYIADENKLGNATVENENGDEIGVGVSGSFEGVSDYYGFKMKAGRMVNLRDSMESKYTCCVSDIFVRQNFGENVNPLGKTVKIAFDDTGIAAEFTIVGVYRYSELKQGRFPANAKEIDKKTPFYIPYMISKALVEDYSMTMPLTIFSYNHSVPNSVVNDHITDFFNEKYESNKDYFIYVENLREELDIINNVIDILTVIVSIIAAISLIVGGVGVMNIMLVSVTERTREIGVRKALGAKKRTIKMQFLTEAVIICLMGGLLGILIGLFNSELIGFIANTIINSNPDYMDLLQNITISPSISAIAVSLLFSSLTGIFFGLYPAGKAAKMNPIDALRYD